MKNCKECINYVKDKCSICQNPKDCRHFMSFSMLFKACYRECNGCPNKLKCDKERV